LKEKVMSEIASILDSSACIAQRAGTFLLTSGHAMSLKPQRASMLRINCGKAWITVQRTGQDYVLHAGEQLRLERGDHVVIESLHAGHVKLDWQALTQRVERIGLRERAVEMALARDLRLQALRDLRGAAVLLARGLGGGFKALALTAHSRASRAQGRIASCESIASSGAV
jgi:hypothetical protein